MLMSESLEDLRERFQRRRALEGKELKVNVHGRECEESRVEDRRSCRSNEMKRCESDRGGDEVYLATFRDEEKTN